MNLPDGYHIGLLAQELEDVFPDLVSYTPMPEDEKSQSEKKGYLAVNYMELIPVLIGAIQEQQWQIADLQDEVARCQCK